MDPVRVHLKWMWRMVVVTAVLTFIVTELLLLAAAGGLLQQVTGRLLAPVGWLELAGDVSPGAAAAALLAEGVQFDHLVRNLPADLFGRIFDAAAKQFPFRDLGERLRAFMAPPRRSPDRDHP